MSDEKAVGPAGGALAPYDYGQDRGGGYEGVDGSDYQVPFLVLLQALSPQLQPGDPRHIPGAAPGMFANTVTRQLFPAGEPVRVVLATTRHQVLQFRPREAGGGFRGAHDPRSELVVAARKAAGGDPRRMRTPDGDELDEAYVAYAFRCDTEWGPEEAVALSFTRSKIKKYRGTMTRLRTVKGAQDVPLFAHRLLLRAVPDKNAAGQPYLNVDLSPAVENDVSKSLMGPDQPAYQAAKGLRDAVVANRASAAFEAATEPGESSDEVFTTGGEKPPF